MDITHDTNTATMQHTYMGASCNSAKNHACPYLPLHFGSWNYPEQEVQNSVLLKICSADLSIQSKTFLAAAVYSSQDLCRRRQLSNHLH